MDLARGHVNALKAIQDNCGLVTYNLGTVLELVEAFERVNGIKIPYVIDDRRAGDVPVVYSDPSKAERELGCGYTGAVKPPVRRTGNRKSGPEETGIYAAEPPSRRNSFPGWGRQLIGYIIRSVPDPVRIPLSWSGSWQDRSERC